MSDSTTIYAFHHTDITYLDNEVAWFTLLIRDPKIKKWYKLQICVSDKEGDYLMRSRLEVEDEEVKKWVEMAAGNPPTAELTMIDPQLFFEQLKETLNL